LVGEVASEGRLVESGRRALTTAPWVFQAFQLLRFFAGNTVGPGFDRLRIGIKAGDLVGQGRSLSDGLPGYFGRLENQW
jgi:hypothetical protein